MKANKLIEIISEKLNVGGLALNERRLATIYVGDMIVNFE